MVLCWCVCVLSFVGVVCVWSVGGGLCVSFVCRSCVRVAKCDKHCELHVSVNHLKVERILFFRVILESMFSCDEGGRQRSVTSIVSCMFFF